MYVCMYVLKELCVVSKYAYWTFAGKYIQHCFY